jgi:hypothetical protein
MVTFTPPPVSHPLPYPVSSPLLHPLSPALYPTTRLPPFTLPPFSDPPLTLLPFSSLLPYPYVGEGKREGDGW